MQIGIYLLFMHTHNLEDNKSVTRETQEIKYMENWMEYGCYVFSVISKTVILSRRRPSY